MRPRRVPKQGAMRSRRVPKGGQLGPGGFQRGTTGRQEGHKRGWEGPNSVQEDPKGKQKGGKRTPGGAGDPRRVRRVAKGTWIGEFDDCYTVS